MGSGGSARFRGVLVLSVQGRSDLGERCVLKAGGVMAFKRCILEFLIGYFRTVPVGSVVNSEYWGNGQDIVCEVLDSVLHFCDVKFVRE